MKQLLFLLLFPCLALAQYQGNSNQKITLGEQTTADGLVWRGRLADTANLLTNKLDTSVYIVLDTGTRAMWYYRVSTTPKWTRLVDSLNNLQGQLSLTTKVTGTLPVANGGTGSGTQNFVDLTTTQSVGGAKTFTDTVRIEDAIKVGANNAYIYSAGTGNYYFTKDYKNQNGLYHIAIGNGVLSNATTVSNPNSSRHGSVGIGFNNLKNLTQSASTNQGVFNTSIGYNNMSSVTTGAFNTGLGANSLASLTTGGSNVAVGTVTLENMTTGETNLGIGDGALRFLTIGNSNIGIGSNAGIFDAVNGSQVTSFDNSIYIGQLAAPSATTGVTNEIVIGKDAKGQGSNSIMLGNSSVTNAYCYDNTFSTPSDFRDKTNIENLNTGLDLILKLRPVKFQWNMRDYGKVGYKDIGFIAQEALGVQNINNEADNIKLVNDENQNQLSMQSGNLIPILVKAMQEQQAQIEALKQRLLILENK